MGTLYDYAQKNISRPISSFWVEWKMFSPVNYDDHVWSGADTKLHQERNLLARQKAWVSSPKVTMHVRRTIQCRMGMPPDLGKEFQSEGFENLVVALE